MKQFTDAEGVTWNVKITAWAMRQAMAELGANLMVCLMGRTEEFALAVFWHSVDQQARQNGVTRENFERFHLTASDLFKDGPFMEFVSGLIDDAIPKAKATDTPEGE